MRFTNTVTIDRPAAAVFAFLADFENLPRWNYAIQETRKISAGPVDVGSRYRQTRTTPVRSEESFEVTEFELNRRVTIRGSLASLPAQIAYTLHPQGTSTVLTNTVDLDPPIRLRLLGPIAAPPIRTAVAANLEVLKQSLER